jgi:hypothetical protein
MTTVIFVHGTGVRRDAYDASFEKVAAALGNRCTVAPCYWGHLGSDLHAGGLSIPTYDTARSLAGGDDPSPTDEDYAVALWGVLYEDPLYELRVLSLREGGVVAELAPGEVTPGAELAQLGRHFEVTPALQSLLQAGGVDREFDEARRTVTHSAPYTTALGGAGTALADYRAAVARAFIAEASARVARQGGAAAVAFDAALRDALEQALIDALGGTERSIGGWMKEKLGGLVCRLGTRYVARRRGALTDAAYPASGDIVLYQARGKEIRSFIRQRIAGVAGPRVVLAHSLGGIACVDLLVSEPIDVDLLVTVGSQAPFFYEINALQSMPHGTPLPGGFPSWLNIYDLRDFLSYVGGKIFPGRVTDVEVDNRQPFPASHSAYWSNGAVWTAIAKELP